LLKLEFSADTYRLALAAIASGIAPGKAKVKPPATITLGQDFPSQSPPSPSANAGCVGIASKMLPTAKTATNANMTASGSVKAILAKSLANPSFSPAILGLTICISFIIAEENHFAFHLQNTTSSHSKARTCYVSSTPELSLVA
jgi:hypothetical protein